MPFTRRLHGLVPACLALLFFFTTPAVATYWTATSYLQVSLETSSYDTDYIRTYTTTSTVKSGVSVPTSVSAVSTSTRTREYDDLTIIYVILPDGTVNKDDLTDYLDSYKNRDDKKYTVYVQPLELTAPASCKSKFTLTTTTRLNVPSEVEDQIKPTSLKTSSRTGGLGYTYITAYLSKDQVPIPTSSLTRNFAYSYYVRSCSTPYAAPTYRSGYDDDNNNNNNNDDSYYRNRNPRPGTTVCWAYGGACTPYTTWVIVVATVIPGLFLLGFIENFFWFRNLMLGKSCLRGGTVCWTLLTLIALCFTRTCQSRNLDDRARLKAQWKDMSFGTKMKLWGRWGFRHAYPIALLGVPHWMNAQQQQQHMGQKGPEYQQPPAPPSAPGVAPQSPPQQPQPQMYQYQGAPPAGFSPTPPPQAVSPVSGPAPLHDPNAPNPQQPQQPMYQYHEAPPAPQAGAPGPVGPAGAPAPAPGTDPNAPHAPQPIYNGNGTSPEIRRV